MSDERRMIFVNLPVTDLERSIRFYEAVGARIEPRFTNEQAAAMVLGDTITVMLLTHDFYKGFTGKAIADAHSTSQVLLCIGCDSRESVDRMVESAAATGGKADPGPRQDVDGMMYGRSFEDPDGHHWEPMWMNSAAAEKRAEADASAA